MDTNLVSCWCYLLFFNQLYIVVSNVLMSTMFYKFMPGYWICFFEGCREALAVRVSQIQMLFSVLNFVYKVYRTIQSFFNKIKDLPVKVNVLNRKFVEQYKKTFNQIKHLQGKVKVRKNALF